MGNHVDCTLMIVKSFISSRQVRRRVPRPWNQTSTALPVCLYSNLRFRYHFRIIERANIAWRVLPTLFLLPRVLRATLTCIRRIGHAQIIDGLDLVNRSFAATVQSDGRSCHASNFSLSAAALVSVSSFPQVVYFIIYSLDGIDLLGTEICISLPGLFNYGPETLVAFQVLPSTCSILSSLMYSGSVNSIPNFLSRFLTLLTATFPPKRSDTVGGGHISCLQV